MSRSWSIWIVSAAASIVVLGVMVWVSVTVLDLDRMQREARRQEAAARRETLLEQDVRLALWRMDSTVAPIVARETARPYFLYRTYLPVGRPYDNMFSPYAVNNGVVASPLAEHDDPHVLLYFQFEPNGDVTSPQVFTDGSNVGQFSPPPTDFTASRRLDDLDRGTSRMTLLETLRSRRGRWEEEPVAVAPTSRAPTVAMQTPEPTPPNSSSSAAGQGVYSKAIADQQQMQRSAKALGQEEYNRRAEFAMKQSRAAVTNNMESVQLPAYQTQAYNAPMPQAAPMQQVLDYFNPPPQQQQADTSYQIWSLNEAQAGFAATPVETSPMTPLWVDGRLILAREVHVDGVIFLQGCWLDWDVLQRELLEAVDDLLPGARLEPIDPMDATDQPRRLATLPARLVAPTIADAALPQSAGQGGGPSALIVSLVVAWCCVGAAAVAVGVLLIGVERLSRRRTAFVTAVTHELRTPLTTFQMYAEMLAEGMVQGEDQRRRYLETLRAESVRLTHMVENVLAYARVQRNAPKGRTVETTLGDVLRRIEPQLRDRAGRDAMEVVVRPNGADGAAVRANVSAIEQILFNLVDNACKYASEASDRRIEIDADADNGRVRLAVRDHGPGVAASVRRRLFKPFSKSADEAAETKPGVGLGLALSRELARGMGGDLRYAPLNTGARFVLDLVKATDAE